jgi:hypothetical protein
VDGNKALSTLVGGELDTVSFVRDYVEFRIDYNVLRALSPPHIIVPTGQDYRFPGAGSRDALCTLIDSSVVEAGELGREDADDRRIEVRTSAGHLLTIPLDASSREGVEAAHLVPADARGRVDAASMWVW